ncbi:hypothetical protein [Micromonospora sp. NPDC001898]|uniref:hypothetical protein n=1 Tax=Micromonospora sp. NPDC001898 TaxID=3364221 RepID=UPI0036A880E3
MIGFSMPEIEAIDPERVFIDRRKYEHLAVDRVARDVGYLSGVVELRYRSLPQDVP